MTLPLSSEYGQVKFHCPTKLSLEYLSPLAEVVSNGKFGRSFITYHSGVNEPNVNRNHAFVRKIKETFFHITSIHPIPRGSVDVFLLFCSTEKNSVYEESVKRGDGRTDGRREG